MDPLVYYISSFKLLTTNEGRQKRRVSSEALLLYRSEKQDRETVPFLTLGLYGALAHDGPRTGGQTKEVKFESR